MDATIDKVAEAGASRDLGHGISFFVRRRIHYGFALLVGQLWVSPVASRHQR